MKQSIEYVGVEAYPISAEDSCRELFGNLMQDEGEFRKIHQYNWEEKNDVVINFH
jgi:hypothetical protein